MLQITDTRNFIYTKGVDKKLLCLVKHEVRIKKKKDSLVHFRCQSCNTLRQSTCEFVPHDYCTKMQIWWHAVSWSKSCLLEGLMYICCYSPIHRWWLASSPAAVVVIWQNFRWSIWTQRRAPRVIDRCPWRKAHQRLTSLFIDALFHFKAFHPFTPSKCVIVQFVL